MSAEELAPHYSAFRVSERLLLTGHSHQAWPDVARDGVLEAWEDAALHVDEKWERAFAKADRVRDGFRLWLDDPRAELALDQNTFGLVLRFLSALDLRRRPRLVTTSGEFHTLRRLMARLAEEELLEVVVVPARPAETLAERLATETDERTAAVLVSAVLYEDSRLVPNLGELATAAQRHGAELLVDVYHALGCMPFPLAAHGLEAAWVVGGGYKYLQLGEGNCFLRLPPQADEVRPAFTGWFAEFAEMAAEKTPGAVEYPRGGMRFAGATYDPTSHYRAARVFDFFADHGLSPDALRANYLRQTVLLAEALGVDDDREAYGGFVTLEMPQAESVRRRLLSEDGVVTDSRGRYLRLGPAPYLSDAQLERTAAAVLGAVAAGSRPC
ncbi:MAG: kynureninase [Actinomycetota bacterium]|nr:kynureninase [Actinomycetota bacterium]